MKLVLAVALVAAPFLISGCAMSGAGGESRYQSDLDRLQADCRARGGVLSPTGRQTSQPALDNVCKVTGEASPRTQPPR